MRRADEHGRDVDERGETGDHGLQGSDDVCDGERRLGERSRQPLRRCVRARGGRTSMSRTAGLAPRGDRRTTPSSSPTSGSDASAGPTAQDQVADLELIIKAAAESAEQRLVVAEYDGEPAGAVLLRGRHAEPAQPRAGRPGAGAATCVPALPAPRRRPDADGGRGHLGRGARHRARRSPRSSASSRDATGSWPGSRSARRPCSGSRRRHAVRAKLTAQLPGKSSAARRPPGRPGARRPPLAAPHPAAED